MVGIPVLFIACLGVATAQSMPQLLVWRFMQAIGSSPGLTIGTAVIGDIYELEERGTALGIFFAVSNWHLFKIVSPHDLLLGYLHRTYNRARSRRFAFRCLIFYISTPVQDSPLITFRGGYCNS